MPNCTNCGAQVNPGVKFCGGCGATLSQSPQQQQPILGGLQSQIRKPLLTEASKAGLMYLLWSCWKDLLDAAKDSVNKLDLGSDYPVMSKVSVIHLQICKIIFYLALIGTTALIGLAAWVIVRAFLSAEYGINIWTLIYFVEYVFIAVVYYFIMNFSWAFTLIYIDFFKVLLKIKDGVAKK